MNSTLVLRKLFIIHLINKFLTMEHDFLFDNFQELGIQDF